MSLFAYDNVQKSEKEVQQAFQALLQFSKGLGNPRFLRIEAGDTIQRLSIPKDIVPFIADFEERGWLVQSNHQIEIKSEWKDYHAPEEAAMKFENVVEKHLSNGGHYYGINSIATQFSIGINFANRGDYMLFQSLKTSVMQRFAKELGLQHFIDVSESRGHKMKVFKGEKLGKQIVKTIAEDVIPLESYEDVEEYFKTHAFFCGVSQLNGKPVIKVVLPSYLEIASMAESKNAKEIATVLEFCGCTWTHWDDHQYRIVYPDGWSQQRYFVELTMSDIENIFEYQDRIEKRGEHV